MAATTPQKSSQINLEVKPASGEMCKVIPLDISVENANSIHITGVPDGAELTSGKKSSQGVWDVDPGMLKNVGLVPPADFSGKLELVVEAVNTTSAGNPQTISKKIVVNVLALSDEDKLRNEFTPATMGQTVWSVILLAVSTIGVIIFWFGLFASYISLTGKEVSVNYKLPDGFVIRSGPVDFRYDAEAGKERLVHIGVIDEAKKKQLVGLWGKIKSNGNGKTGEKGDSVSKQQADYMAAIDKLTLASLKEEPSLQKMLLLLAGLSGLLGVQIRSIINFIGNTCFKNALDIKRWWSWYFLRPLEGFALGVVSVLAIKSGIFVPEGSSPSGANWWLAITILVGFGADDFAERLRLVSHALFGKTKS